MINWRVRIKNRAFWLALIPAALLLLQQALRLCGVDFDAGHGSVRLCADFAQPSPQRRGNQKESLRQLLPLLCLCADH